MLKFKAEDQVKITAGKDKDREGKIEKVFPDQKSVVIAGVNIFKKHIKQRVARDGKGGILEIARPISFAKIALVCPKCKKLTRVGFRLTEDKKIRVCKKCKLSIETKE